MNRALHLMCCVAVAFGTAKLTEPAPNLEAGKITAENIAAKSLTIVNDKGETMVTISRSKDGSGIWIHGEKSNTHNAMVAIYVDDDHGAVIGTYGDVNSNVRAMHAAVGARGRTASYKYIAPSGKVQYLTPAKPPHRR